MDVSKIRRAEQYAKMVGDGPVPRGTGDNNRSPHERPQMVNKVFQKYHGSQQNPPQYGEGDTVPFNIGTDRHY